MRVRAFTGVIAACVAAPIAFGAFVVTARGADSAPPSRSVITGTITDPNGQPIRDISVDLYDAAGKVLQTTGTVHDPLPQYGTYEFGNVAAGSYKVCFDTPLTAQGSYQPYRRECFENAATPDAAAAVTVKQGKVLTLDAQLEYATGSVSGRITDASGQPPANSTVWVEYTTGATVFASAAADGSYSRAELRTGDVRVCASASDFVTPDTTTCTATFHVEDGQASTDVNLVVA